MRRFISVSVEQIPGTGPRRRQRTMCDSRVSLEHLQFRNGQLIQSGIAFNSLSTYNVSLSAFEKFRSLFALEKQMPIPVQHIILFLSYCFDRGMSPRSISTYLAGINYYHKLNGFYDLRKVFIIGKILEGCHRSRISLDNRAPITMQVLIKILNVLPRVCYDNYEVRLFTAIFILAYFGLFRASELVATSQYHFRNSLQENDVFFLENGAYLVVRLRHSKTNQRGNPVFLKLPKQANFPCPVKAVETYLLCRTNVQGPLFSHKDGSVVTKSQFSAVLSKAVKCSYYVVNHYKTHSFRIGRATDLASLGYPSDVIKRLGRWSSNCYSNYIRV